MKAIVLSLLCGLASVSYAQGEPVFNFPINLKPGDTFTVRGEYPTSDRLLQVTKLSVLPEEDLRELTKMVLEGQIDRKLVVELEKKAEILGEIRTEQRAIITLNREGYDHYRKLWEETDLLLEKEEIRSAQRFRKGFTVGGLMSAVGILVVKLIVN